PHSDAGARRLQFVPRRQDRLRRCLPARSLNPPTERTGPMRRLILGAIALGLLFGCAGVAQTSADTTSRLCGDYALGLEAATPLKPLIPAKAITVIDRANAIGGAACAFTASAAAYQAAVAGWTAAKGA